MGTGDPFSSAQFLQLFQPDTSGLPSEFTQARSVQPKLGPVSGRAPTHQKPPLGLGKKGDTFAANDAQALADEFEGIIYQSQMARASLSVQLQQAAARVTGSGEEGEAVAEGAAQQLKFDFFAEVRTEELVRFEERTTAVAEGRQGAQRETFVEASRSVAARFAVSIEISGAALNGFAGAAEGLQDAEEGFFDQFLGFAQDALSQADEALNEMLGMLQDFFGGENNFQAMFQGLLDGFGDLGQLGGAGGTAGTESAVQSQSFSMTIQMEFEFTATMSVEGVVQESDPIVFDLDGDGVELTSYRQGARFDIVGNGQSVNTAFVTGGDAFLAVDRNGNGTIDSGRELFGDQNGAANGFEELRKLDSNADGRINSLDRDFDSLRLFKDNGNGKTEEGELVSLSDAGIEEIMLGYRNVNQVASGGNRLAQLASFTFTDGRRGQAADAILNYMV
jgi:hypothetical protein